jgi:hypothetical protein
MLGSFELQRISHLVKVVDMNVHVVTARSKQPRLMRRKPDLLWWVSVMRKDVKGLCEIS